MKSLDLQDQYLSLQETSLSLTHSVLLQECHDRIRLICASDGVTYTNKCEMRRLACQRGTRVSAVHEGMCARKTNMNIDVTFFKSKLDESLFCFQTN